MDDQESNRKVREDQESTGSSNLDGQSPSDEKTVGSVLFKKIGIPVLLIVLCLVVSLCIQQGLNSMSFGDCFGYAWNVLAYIDLNEDGLFQSGEPPLPGVTIQIGLANAFEDTQAETTNWNGKALMSMGCREEPENYMIKVTTPAGYRLTTPEVYALNRDEARNPDYRIEVGFAYLPGMPTATPRPLTECTSFPEFAGQEITTLAAQSENVWVGIWSEDSRGLPLDMGKLTRIDLSGRVQENYPYGVDFIGHPTHIFESPDGNIWLVTERDNPDWKTKNEGTSQPMWLSTIYIWNGQYWEEFAPIELKGKVVKSIVWAPDKRQLFGTWGDGIFIWNPMADEWFLDHSVDKVSEILFARDGKYFAISNNGGAIAPDGKVWGVNSNDQNSNTVNYYDPATGQIQPGATGLDNYNEYLDVKFDSLGGMWLATTQGLLYISDPLHDLPKTWQYYGDEIGLPDTRVNTLLLEQDNIFWVGTRGGLARCEIHTH